jgi:D-arabinose 1-dehydrogenase-like Zn-dependent alcohol dehydrogenase
MCWRVRIKIALPSAGTPVAAHEKLGEVAPAAHGSGQENHHLCPQVQATIVGHRGGFATHIRAHWAWTIPLPEKLDFAEAGPLLCGGITVFAPLTMYTKPTGRVGIIGIGGLGHMAVKFAAADFRGRRP